jgi:DNA processing protein
MKTTQDTISWLRLARSENIGKSTFFRLIKVFKTPQNALDQIPQLISKGNFKRKISICSISEAEKEIANTQKFGAEILLFSDEKYPRLLREIPDPAPILTIKGDLDFFNRDAIAIVGARNASYHATTFAKTIALELGQRSIVTVSGMARGVDAAAHEASILSGTIAVIAGGIDHIYPSENTALYHDIAKRGLLVSETPFGMAPKGGNFVQRNRLISGLSLATVVIEAGLKSGSLITAKCAIEQGREVFAMPGSPFDLRCQGSNRLIKDGANMIETVHDILQEFAGMKARFGNVGRLEEPEASSFVDPISKMPSNLEIDKVSAEILSKLSFAPIAIDELIDLMQLPARLVNIALISLELTDQIQITCGKVILKSSG